MSAIAEAEEEQSGIGGILLQREAEVDLGGAPESSAMPALYHAVEDPGRVDRERRWVERLDGPVGEVQARATLLERDAADGVWGIIDPDIAGLAAYAYEIAPIRTPLERAPEDVQRALVGDGLAPVAEAPVEVDGEPAPLPEELEHVRIRRSHPTSVTDGG